MTPLMRQYWDIKTVHQDKILLFRMGDFFELFFDDAVTAAPILGITLTQRNKKSSEETPMCGVPHHAIAGPINRLLQAGYKVAICDQIEDPKTAKGIVKRAVTRILTPGMVYDVDTLDGSKSHYIASVEDSSLSFADVTTGECFYLQIENSKQIRQYLQVLPVAEVVISSEFPKDSLQDVVISVHDDLVTDSDLLSADAPKSAKRLLSYLASLSSSLNNQTLQKFVKRDLVERLQVSATVLRHLEVFQTYKGETIGSLFHALNRTQTSAGARLFRQYLSFPLRDLNEIQRRLDSIQAWQNRHSDLKSVRQILSRMGDIERRLAKIAQPQCNARDLLALSQALSAGCEAIRFANPDTQGSNLVSVLELADKIEKTFVEEPPLQTRQGHMIRKGVSATLDEWIELSTNAQNLVSELEQKEKLATGISSLKLRYNNVFGFYIEITNTHKDKVPDRYQRKQTLTNAERYCTDELIELERKVLSAQSKRSDLEFEIFEDVRKSVLKKASDLLVLSKNCSELDVITSLSWLALEEKYVRPSFNLTGKVYLSASRHPVVEQTVKSQFIPNDILMEHNSCMLLTGPNMAGKSTLMRQVAVAAMMAQMGSFVPASEASLPVFDSVFTRIGASDQLSEGLSTFMVEMTETAEILAKATEKSLVVLDEIGRGTSTFDGMCLAQSILEHLLQNVKCVTMFATHYHELTVLQQVYSNCENCHMKVSEKNGEIRFLHTLVKGPAGKSYGIQVADLAGLPKAITQRAKVLLNKIESSSEAELVKRPNEFQQLSLLDSNQDKLDKLMNKFRQLSVNAMTPLQAMNVLSELQSEILTD